MSYSVSGTMITLTRGDTFTALITITDSEGNQYVPVKGDRIRLILVIEPEDTKPLAFGKYVYDIELTKVTGEVDTFITKATLKLTEEVH